MNRIKSANIAVIFLSVGVIFVLSTTTYVGGTGIANASQQDEVAAAGAHAPQAKKKKKEFTDTFGIESCEFTSVGRNPFFILEPGHQLVLEGRDEGKNVRLVITVLNETQIVQGVETRVVEEKESKDGQLFEVSRNFFAICTKTNSVFYFGEDVEFFENGRVVGTDGTWRAGVDNARPGIIMPGTLLLGARYFQEIAPGVALDQAEIVSLTAVVETPAGRFTNALETIETTPLDRKAEETKFYAPGIGLINDGPLKLVSATGLR